MKIKSACTLICLLGLMMCACALQAQDLSKFDLSTNEGVNAAREAVNGKPVDDRSKRCLRRDKSLSGIVIVGNFAYDYGCRLEGAFIASRYLTARDKGLSKAALEELGWKAANQQQREALAQAWVTKGLLGFSEVASKKPEDFADHPFQSPGVVTRANGETAVTLWVRLPSGRSRGRAYQLREYKFSSDADFAGYTTLEDFPKAKTASGTNFSL
ncbi:MAG: hypothetical protein ACXW18_11025 [Pyrinomonadaceae bacterium]